MKKIVFDKPPRILDTRNLLLVLVYMTGISIMQNSKGVIVSFGTIIIMLTVLIYQYRDDTHAKRHYEEKINELQKKGRARKSK